MRRSGATTRIGRIILAIVLFPLTTTTAGPAEASAEMTVDERVACRTAVEQVYWNRRSWPEDNPSAKPSLSSVLPEPAIRRRVEDGLRAENACAGTGTCR